MNLRLDDSVVSFNGFFERVAVTAARAPASTENF